MKRINKYVVLLLLIMGFAVPYTVAEPLASLEVPVSSVNQVVTVAPISVVSNPEQYLNKVIKMDARFDKFSTLGLDYPPAMRSNTDYISFMIYRDDTSFEIPLSEMKLFMKRDDAQKFIELKSNDRVQITGKVFSTALGDPWIDVQELKTVNK